MFLEPPPALPSPPRLPDPGKTVVGHGAPPRPVAPSQRGRATVMLLLATAFWGLSFPLTKAVQLAQATQLVPGASTWFLSAVALAFRFGLAAAVMAGFAARTLPKLTRREFSQGLGLGIFGGAGMFLQFDGLNYTAASTSAFLTNCYCVILPVIVALRCRRLPSRTVVVCSGLVLAGMAVLADLDPAALRLGRGELETLGSAAFFAGQIFWLERPAFHKNRTAHATLVMFAVIAALGVGALGVNGHGSPGREAVAACASWPVLGCLLALTGLCTLVTFTLMNHWQRHVEATEAGLIYCAEPVWTSGFALFLPAMLAAWTAVSYPNERLTARLLLGGGLITLANVVLQLRPPSGPAAASAPTASPGA